MHVQVPVVPETIRTLAAIDVVDPWSPKRKTHFDLIECKHGARGGGGLGGHVVSLRAKHNGEERMLPEALLTLWQRGDVTSEQLPALLHATGDRYGAVDAELVLPVRRHVYMFWALCVIAVVCFAMAMQGWLASRSAESHGYRAHSLADLEAGPLHDFESISVNATVPVDASAPIGASPPHTPHLFTAAGNARLVVVKMGDRERLVWTTMPEAANIIALVGVVWPASALPNEVQCEVDRFAQRYPHLEREHVIGHMWIWADSRDDLKLPLFGGLGACMLLVGGLVYWAVSRRQKRRWRDVEWLQTFARERGFTATRAGAPSAL